MTKTLTGYTFIMPEADGRPCSMDRAQRFHTFGWNLKEKEWWQLDVTATKQEAERCARRWERATAKDLRSTA